MAKRILDERIIAELRRFAWEGYNILYFGLFLIFITRFFMGGGDLKNIWDIFTLLMIASVHMTIRLVTGGLYITRSKKDNKSFLASGLVGGVVFSIIMSILNPIHSVKDLIKLGAGFLVFVFAWIYLQLLFMKWSNKVAEKEIGEE